MKKQGFTLIEILGVISILGVIAIIAMPSVEYVINQGKEKAYDIQISSIKLAIKDYLTDNKQMLGDEYEISISIEDLKNEGYLDFDFRNPNTNKCFNNDNNFVVTKKTDDEELYSINAVSEGSEEDCGSFENSFTLLLNGSSIIKIDLGSEFIDPGVVAFDSDGNNMEDNVIITGEVNVDKPGSYKLTYTLSENNLTVTKVREVIVVDKTPPVFEYIEPKILMTSVKTFDLLEGIVAEDDSGDDVVVSTTTNLVLGVVGTYYVDYIAKDSSNNISKVSRDVIVVQGFTDESYFVFENGEITDYKQEGPKNVVIPNTIRGEKVISIGSNAFDSSKLKSVIIPNSVTTIKKSAFMYNLFEKVIIPSSVVDIEMYAFARSSLTEIVIPNSVKTIGMYAFAENKISKLVIPDSVEIIEEAAFNSNLVSDSEAFIFEKNRDGTYNNQKIISYAGAKKSNITIPSSVTTIGNNAFNGCGLTNINIPNNVTSIGRSAFSSNKLVTVTIPNTVTDIDEYAFSYNKLTSLTLSNSISIINSAVFYNNELTKVTIPSTVNVIATYAFKDNNITTLTLPTSITKIGEKAFTNNPIKTLYVKKLVYKKLSPYNWYDTSGVSINYQ